MAFYVSYEGALRAKIAQIDAQMEQEISQVKARAELEIKLIKHKADEARWEAAIEEANQMTVDEKKQSNVM